MKRNFSTLNTVQANIKLHFGAQLDKDEQQRLNFILTELFIVNSKKESITLDVKTLFDMIQLAYKASQSQPTQRVQLSKEQLEKVFLSLVQEFIHKYKTCVTDLNFTTTTIIPHPELSEESHKLLQKELETNFVG
jgi:hypothetical protein